MRLVKNEFLATVKRNTLKHFLVIIIQWSIGLLFKITDPGIAGHVVNDQVQRAFKNEDAKYICGVWVAVWKRKNSEFISVGRNVDAKTTAKILRDAARNIEGNTLKIRGVI